MKLNKCTQQTFIARSQMETLNNTKPGSCTSNGSTNHKVLSWSSCVAYLCCPQIFYCHLTTMATAAAHQRRRCRRHYTLVHITVTPCVRRIIIQHKIVAKFMIIVSTAFGWVLNSNSVVSMLLDNYESPCIYCLYIILWPISKTLHFTHPRV